MFRSPDPRTNRKDLQRLVGLFMRRDIGVFHAGGMAACSRWPSAATPPVGEKNRVHPEGMPADLLVIIINSFAGTPVGQCRELKKTCKDSFFSVIYLVFTPKGLRTLAQGWRTRLPWVNGLCISTPTGLRRF